jgi:hypothetical protein
MKFSELTAVFMERLNFYGTILDKLEQAVRGGDTDRIAAYSELESRTAAEIACLRGCFIARRDESPHAGEPGSALDALLTKIRGASRRLRDLLEAEKQSVWNQLQNIRGKIPPGNFQTEPPSLIDCQV